MPWFKSLPMMHNSNMRNGIKGKNKDIVFKIYFQKKHWKLVD